MFHNVDMLSFYFCKQEYKITMSNTRNSKSSARLIPTRKIMPRLICKNIFPLICGVIIVTIRTT